MFFRVEFFSLDKFKQEIDIWICSSSALQNEFGNIAKMFIASLTFIPKAVAYIPIL